MNKQYRIEKLRDVEWYRIAESKDNGKDWRK